MRQQPQRAATPSSGPPRWRTLLVIAGLLLLATPMHAQNERAARDTVGLRLDVVVRETLVRGPLIVVARWQRQSMRGIERATRGTFDVMSGAFVSTGRERLVQSLGASDPATVLNQASYGVSAQRQFRSGIVVRPDVSLTSTAIPGTATPRTGVGDVGVAIILPLARNFGQGVAASQARAAERYAVAAEVGVRAAAAAAVLESVISYWAYAAAQLRLDARRQSESRALRLIQETEALVRADERPAGDLVSIRANVATRVAARLASEQLLLDARARLGLAMGISSDAIQQIPAATTPFPVLPPPVAIAEQSASAPATLREVMRGAVRRRPDLTVARERRAATRVTLTGARNALLPQMDLNVRLGFAGLTQSSDRRALFSPLYENVSGLNSTVQLSFGLPMGNNSARGQAEQAEATDGDAEFALANLTRQVEADLAVSSAALSASMGEGTRTAEAVRLNEQAVEQVRLKFRLGSATVFDVMFAEDQLTAAWMADADARQRYATALVRWRFETGALVHDNGAQHAVAVDSLLSVPR